MAKKGRKFNNYAPELILEILDKYFSGKGSARSLGLEYGISHKTINNWI